MTTISERAVMIIKKSLKTKNRLALHFNKTQNTIGNWINSRDAMLTTPDAITIISEETGLGRDEILNEDTIAA